MVPRIGDTLTHTDKDGNITNITIVTERDRQLAIDAVNRDPHFQITQGSYLKDRSSFGPASHEGRMFDGNVLVGGNVRVAKLTKGN